MAEPIKADLKTVREYFEEGGPKIAATEFMALKKDKATDTKLIDYDQIAIGIADGSFTYPDDEEQIEAAKQITHHPTLRV